MLHKISRISEKTERKKKLYENGKNFKHLDPDMIYVQYYCHDSRKCQPSEWVLYRMRRFSKSMGVAITGHQEEVMWLFMTIKGRGGLKVQKWHHPHRSTDM